jgi:hypothetical protein
VWLDSIHPAEQDNGELRFAARRFLYAQSFKFS